MEEIQKRIIENFGNRLRVRVCGILIEENHILLVNHQSLRKKSDFWAPPGGGMDFGTSAEENLKREFVEETGLMIDIENFLFVHEYLHKPLHAVELIFQVKRIGGTLNKGFDPEMNGGEQIIKDVRFISINALKNMPLNSLHQMLIHWNFSEEKGELPRYALSKD